MRHSIVIFFIFFTTTSIAQKSIDTIKGTYDRGTIWFDNTKKIDRKLGLQELEKSNDSLNFRFRNNYSIVDISIMNNGQLKAFVYLFSYRLDKKKESQNIIFEKQKIDPKVAKSILDTFFNHKIDDFYDGNKIKGYPIILHGVTYTFEIANRNIYKYFSFSNPQSVVDIPEAMVVNSFSTFTDITLDLRNNFIEFRRSLPAGRYLNGMTIYTARK